MTETLDFTIFGVGRSGTTALKQAANLHPRVFCAHEWQIALRRNAPAPSFPEMLQDPGAFGLPHKLKPIEVEWLAQKLAHGRTVSYGNKFPGYYLHFRLLNVNVPNARHTAIYRSLYTVTQSWDARAANEADSSWHRGQVGLFAIFEWVMLLDCLARNGDRIHVVPFDQMFFGSAAGATYERWLHWASGIRVPAPIVAAFEKKLLGRVPPDQNRAAACRYTALLQHLGVSTLDAAVQNAGFAPARALAADFRAYVAAVAEPLAHDLVDLLRVGGDSVAAYAAIWIRDRRNRYYLDPLADLHVLRALDTLASAFIPDAPTPRRPPAGKHGEILNVPA